jgi:regulator of RNase E activity RraA
MSEREISAHIEALKKLPTGVVCDALGRLGLSGFTDGIYPMRIDAKMAGRARTVRFSARRGAEKNDFNMYRFIRTLQPGDILTIATDSSDSWIYGENLVHEAQYHGLGGVVADCMARDGAQLAALDLPCFARGLAVRPPGFEIVATDVPVSLQGAQVYPGDVLVGDADGIVVVPFAHLANVRLQAEDLEGLEGEQERAIATRAPLPELLAILGRKKIVKK